MHGAEPIPPGMEHVTELLSQRMLANGLDQPEIARIAPAILRELQRQCALCESREECALGLLDDFADVSWAAYCPNAATLNDLAALSWFRVPLRTDEALSFKS
jgi:hypothetical protein